MRKHVKVIKGFLSGLLVSICLLRVGLVTEASNVGQPLPETGEEIAKTGLVIGGIIIVIVIIIVLIRRRKK